MTEEDSEASDSGHGPLSRREMLSVSGFAAAAVSGVAAVGTAQAQSSTEPRLNLGDSYHLDDDPDGNGDLVVTDVDNSNEVMRYDRSAGGWVVSQIETDTQSVNKVGASAYLSTDQTVQDSTDTKIKLDTERFDHFGNFDTANHQYEIPEDGTYIIVGSVRMLSVPDQSEIEPKLIVNGSSIGTNPTTTSGASRNPAVQVTSVDELVAGDIVELYVRQISGTSLDAQGSEKTFLSPVRIG